MLQALNIDKKRKRDPMAIASLRDFKWSAGEEIDARILSSPCVTLYCLDDERRRAIFVEMDPDIDVTQSTFLHQGQYKHARRLLALPYDSLVRSAATLDDLSLLFVHSVGRCGSTLLCQSFRQLHFVRVLSEPDFFSNVAHLRMNSARSDEELVGLLRGGGRFLAEGGEESETTTVVVKLRSSCIEVADLLAHAFPEARQMFLYRDLRPWIVSNARAFLSLHGEVSPDIWRLGVSLFARDVPLLQRYMHESQQTPSAAEMYALQWLSIVHGYVEQRATIPMPRVRYEDMVARPEQTLADVFSCAGIPGELVDAGLRAFERDAQEGTVMSRDAVRERARVNFSEGDWDRVRSITRRYGLSPADADAFPDIVASMAI